MRALSSSNTALLPFAFIVGAVFLIQPVFAQIVENRGIELDTVVYQVDNLGADVFDVDPSALNPDPSWQTKVQLRMAAKDIAPDGSLIPWARQFLISGRNSSANIQVGPEAEWSLNAGYFASPEIAFVNLFMNTFANFTGAIAARDIDTLQNVPESTIVTLAIHHFGADGEVHLVSFCGDRDEPVVTGLEHITAVQSGGYRPAAFGGTIPSLLFSDKNGRVTNQQGDVGGNCEIELIWQLPAAPPLPDLPLVGFDDNNPSCGATADPPTGAIDARQYHESGQGGTAGCNDPSARHPHPTLLECQEGDFQGWDHVVVRFKGNVNYFFEQYPDPTQAFTISADSLYDWSNLNRVPPENCIASVEAAYVEDTALDCINTAGDGFPNALKITFCRPIDYVSWTTITQVDTNDSVTLGFLPGDVNGNAVSTKKDCKKLKKYLRELEHGNTPPFELTEEQSNIDRNTLADGVTPLLEWPEDHIACQDLINGHGHGYRKFKKIRLPCYDDDDDDNSSDDSSDGECDDES